jgi:hypothetical protein
LGKQRVRSNEDNVEFPPTPSVTGPAGFASVDEVRAPQERREQRLCDAQSRVAIMVPNYCPAVATNDR